MCMGLMLVEVSAEGEKEHKVEATCSVVLMPGSLLVFKDSAYTGEFSGFQTMFLCVGF